MLLESKRDSASDLFDFIIHPSSKRISQVSRLHLDVFPFELVLNPEISVMTNDPRVGRT